MDIQVGDRVELKKPHPCGGHGFEVLRVGMDFRLKCLTCAHEMLVPRARIERFIRKVERND